MMNSLLFLLMSALCTNGVHGYLLYSQRHDRKWSISVHAVKSSQMFLLYILGHVLGGAFFLLFAKEYFVDTVGIDWLFYLALVAVFFEYVQAFLPAKGSTNQWHANTAIAMWGSYILLGFLSIFILPVAELRRLIVLPLYALIFFLLVKTYLNKQRMYKYQMMMIPLFYATMFVLCS